MDILEAARARSGALVGLRRRLHAVAEVGKTLPETQALVCRRLDELGIPYRMAPGGAGLWAWVRGGGSGGTVGLRADMDGLHLREETGLPYAAQNGNMHACGHDAHTAMLLTAAELLRDMGDGLRGNVTLLFQSGEEGLAGAKDLLEAGALDEPYHVDVLFGQHAGVLSDELGAGAFGFRPGSFMASRDTFCLTVHGRGCHGSAPERGVDPVVVSAQLVLALQTLVSRECGGNDRAVLTIGAIHGGEVYNIIPDQVALQGAIRCLDEALRERLLRRITELSQGLCAAMRARCDVRILPGYPVLVNDPAATAFAAETAAALLGREAARPLQRPLMCSEDMAFLLRARPGCYWCFATPPSDGPVYPNHSPRFRLDDGLLWRGAALLAAAAAGWLRDREGGAAR